MSKAILFTNYSAEDFTHQWNSVDYDFPAGQSMYLEGPLALHFAKHLAVRELNKKNLPTDKHVLEEEMKKALQVTNIEAKDDTKLKQEVLDENKKVDEKEEVKEEVTNEQKEEGEENPEFSDDGKDGQNEEEEEVKEE